MFQLPFLRSGSARGHTARRQVLVGPEMPGLSLRRRPRFAKRSANLAEAETAAARSFVWDVGAGSYPDSEHSYDRAIEAG